MSTMLLVHVIAGAIGLLTGYAASTVAKGGSAHRQGGRVFVYAMLVMSFTGFLVSAIEAVAPLINLPTAALTFYLVVTALTTVRDRNARVIQIDRAAMWCGIGIAAACAGLTVVAISKGGAESGMAFPLVMFGAVAAIGANGDRRMLRADALKGAPRLRRHLWRMCFALFIASIAFYLGPNRLPEALRIPALRVGATFLPIAVMSYWLWRVRARRAAALRTLVQVKTQEAF